jgi:hypothetical protein
MSEAQSDQRSFKPGIFTAVMLLEDGDVCIPVTEILIKPDGRIGLNFGGEANVFEMSACDLPIFLEELAQRGRQPTQGGKVVPLYLSPWGIAYDACLEAVAACRDALQGSWPLRLLKGNK